LIIERPCAFLRLFHISTRPAYNTASISTLRKKDIWMDTYARARAKEKTNGAFQSDQTYETPPGKGQISLFL